MRVVICANAAWNLYNFRAGLIRALLECGTEVFAVAPSDGRHEELLEQLGCRFEALPMDSKGTSPAGDSLLFLRYLRLFSRLRPDAYLGYTIKPNIYGSLAAGARGIPVVNNVSGLGTAFLSHGWLAAVARRLYRQALRRSRKVFFQNPDDLSLFVDGGLVGAGQAALLPGSGVDLVRFSPQPRGARPDGSGPAFLLIARLLRDKGVVEYVEAARRVKEAVPGASFRLLGFLESDNRTALSRQTVEGWVREGAVDYLGAADDVRPFIAEADCVVLPSYREGTPRSLLEAAAMARPLIATDVPGCREAVEDGVNGFLCRPRDAESLADAMLRFAGLSQPDHDQMGSASRAMAETRFDESIVIRAYLEVLGAISR
jgi:glycosyltransferase involved in cell wall biosynthesis